jgi:hypothetical protein
MLNTLEGFTPNHLLVVIVSIKEQFRGRRWMNLLSEHLEYQYTQILFVGEKSSITGKEAIEQLEKLEEEDEARINHLQGSVVLNFSADDKVTTLYFKIWS